MIIRNRLVEFGVRFYLFVMGQMPLIIVIVPYHYVVFCRCFIAGGGAARRKVRRRTVYCTIDKIATVAFICV